ncbi:hypothetical protein P8452_62620 [Trifolium repens]|nr:hypothetical protein P8452_62620 [Trifolium repens]
MCKTTLLRFSYCSSSTTQSLAIARKARPPLTSGTTPLATGRRSHPLSLSARRPRPLVFNFRFLKDKGKRI